MNELAAIYLALNLIQLTGPDGQVILLDVDKIATIRTPRTEDHFANNTHCLIFTTDTKNINVVETCDQVRKLLGPYSK